MHVRKLQLEKRTQKKQYYDVTLYTVKLVN